MKRWEVICASAIILAVVAAAFLRKSPEPPPVPKPKPVMTSSTDDGMKLVAVTDPKLVFQKAFWRRPGDDDKILHAERREWSSGDGVRKWQWFIAVTPGSQLEEWLATNPFSLAAVKTPNAIEKPPEWFPKSPEGFQIQQNPEGRFILMRSADGKQLYATDSGQGFSAPGIAP